MDNAIDLTPQYKTPLETAPDFVKQIFDALAKKVEAAQPMAIRHAVTTCNSTSEKTGLAMFGQQAEDDRKDPPDCYASVFEVMHAHDIDHSIVVVQRDANRPLARTLMSYPPVNGVYPVEMIADDIFDFWMGDS